MACGRSVVNLPSQPSTAAMPGEENNSNVSPFLPSLSPAADLPSAFMDNILLEALHDSPHRCGVIPRSKITHHAIKDEISGKIRGLPRVSSVHYNLLWVYGPAGVGKTAIMHSIAEGMLQQPNTRTFCDSDTPSGAAFMGSGFFFSVKNQVTDHRMLFSTLAYGLARGIPGLAPYIQFIFDVTPNVRDLSLKEQCDALIINPIRFWAPCAMDDYDILMVIDGLDECDGGEETHIEILNVIHQAFDNEKIDRVRWHWVISSRSEAWIHSKFVQFLLHPRVQTIPIPLASQVETTRYIHTSLSGIRTSYLLSPLSTNTRRIVHVAPASSSTAWVSNQTIDTIRWHSSGYFAYSASLFAYIDRPNANPYDRLRTVASHTEHASFQHKEDNMFAQLDAMYQHILSRVPLHSLELTKRVLGAISLMQPSSSQDSNPTACAVAELLGITIEELHSALYYLNSVVTAPIERPDSCMGLGDLEEPSFTNPELTFCHKSFNEFLRNPSRSGTWSIDARATHADLAKCCLLRILAAGPSSDNSRCQHGDAYLYAVKRWFVHCWRTGMDAEGSSSAVLPGLYEFDYTCLPADVLVDRYFVEWLLSVQELTMSEYLILNPGPQYSLEAPPNTDFDRRLATRYRSSRYPCPSTSTYPFTARTTTTWARKLPPTPTYILGLEPTKQVLLAPVFDPKEQEQGVIRMDRIGPKEKWWDWIRGFRVARLTDAEEQIARDGVRGGLPGYVEGGGDGWQIDEFGMGAGARGIYGQDYDYDEFLARSLAWEEENSELVEDEGEGDSRDVLEWRSENQSSLNGSTIISSGGDTVGNLLEALYASAEKLEEARATGDGEDAMRELSGGLRELEVEKQGREREQVVALQNSIKDNVLLNNLDAQNAGVGVGATTSANGIAIPVPTDSIGNTGNITLSLDRGARDARCGGEEDEEDCDYFSAGEESGDSSDSEMVVVDSPDDTSGNEGFEMVEREELLH